MQSITFDLLAMTMVPGLGAARLARLLERVSEPAELLSAPRAQLRALRLTTDEQFYLVRGWARRDAEAAVKEARRLDVGIVSPWDEVYPRLLKEIYDPPHILYYRGSPGSLSGPGVAIVGSRQCSPYGREVAFAFARDLAGFGLTVFSGMARGTDSQAHLGALEGGGKTVAVMGTGVDVIYPKSHRRLYSRILESGCVVSEFRLGTFAAPQNFPIRNRIISGLSLGTLVPEASEFSGSLITARLTLEQNRELWAVPGDVTNPGSYGPNHLIRQGARPILTARDVLEELPLEVLDGLRQSGERKGERTREAPSGPPLEPRERQLMEHLKVESATHFDRLLAETGWNVTDLSAVLISLERKRLIRCFPGRRYTRILEGLVEPIGGDSRRNRTAPSRIL